MSKFPLFCITFLLLTAGSAVCQDVHYNFDRTADFSKFKTYKWITLNSEAPIDELTDEQIKAAVDAALSKRGLTKISDGGTADLLVGYQTTELIDEQFAKIPTWDSTPRTIYHGDLAIDMYTPANQHLVWRGVASKSLNPKAKPEKRQKNLNKAVTKLMQDYPPAVAYGPAH